MAFFCISGTFQTSYSYTKAVDFTTPLLNDHWTIAIPIAPGDDFLSFLYPFALEVWMFTIVSIPSFILATTLTDYLYTKCMGLIPSFELESSITFVMRTVLTDNSFMYVKHNHKRILVVTWLLSVFVLVQAYAGTLTAMITKPGLQKTIKNADDLLSQKDLSWVMEDGLGVGEFMKESPAGSTLRQLVEKASFLSYDEEWYGACQTRKTWKSRRFASICDIYSITDLISNDYR